MYIFGTQVDNEGDNQVEYLDTDTKTLTRMGPSSKPPGNMSRLDECSVPWNQTQLVHIRPYGELDILDLILGQVNFF